MKTIGILYATREGQARRIASYVAQKLSGSGYAIEVVDVAHADGVSLDVYEGVVLVSSVHIWRHEPEMFRFVKRHRLALAEVPSAFLSVSLCQAGAEDPKVDATERARKRLEASWLMDRFFAEAYWHPSIAKSVAGALRYTQYSLVTKLVLQQFARRAGASTDTSQDHEYTNWDGLDDFVERYRAILERAAERPRAVA